MYLIALNNNYFRAVGTSFHSYSFEIIPEPVTIDSENNKIIVSYTSVGNVENNQKKISGTIEAEKTPEDQFLTTIPANAVIDPKIDPNQPYTSPVYFPEGLTLNGEKQPIIFLNGFYSTIVDQENKTIILVKSINGVEANAYIRNDLDLKTNGNDALMCVEGTLYLYGNVNPEPVVDTTLNCENKKNAFINDPKIYSGIFARAVEKRPLFTLVWKKEKLLVKAQYK